MVNILKECLDRPEQNPNHKIQNTNKSKNSSPKSQNPNKFKNQNRQSANPDFWDFCLSPTLWKLFVFCFLAFGDFDYVGRF
jgi:hypothetical protein